MHSLPSFIWNPRRPLFLLSPLLAGIAFAWSPLAVLHAAEPTAQVEARSFDITPGPLADRIAEFAAAAGVQLFFDAQLLAGQQSAGLKGSYSIAAGFEQLLRGSGFAAVQRAPGEYGLRAVPKAEVTLAPVKVRARNSEETAYGPVPGYVAKRSATGTKTDALIVEIPQSISVITAAQIDTIKPQNLTEVLLYTPGIAKLEGYDRTADDFMIRGFEAYAGGGSIYRDGTKYTANIYDGQQELYGLERIEVLKGAASVLFGAAAPGGIVNTVSKKPTLEPLRELNLDVGSNDRKQISGDFGGALDDDGVWSYRLTALARDSDTFIDYVPDNRRYVAPAVTWRPSAATALTLLAQYQRNQTVYAYGLPPSGTLESNPNGSVPRDRFVGEPGFDDYDGTMRSVGLLFEHAFDDNMKLRASARRLSADVEFPNVGGVYLDSDQRTLVRAAYDRWDRSATVSGDVSMEIKASTGAVAHTLIVGIDDTDQQFETERYTRDIAALDLYAPVYGAEPGEPVPMAWSNRSETNRLGFYAQDQLKIAERWVVAAGVRHDRARDRRSPYFEENWQMEESKATTGRLGVVYLTPSGWAPFASFSQSFEPQSGTDTSGERFEPTRGEQYEIGTRYQPVGTETLLSAAIYELTQRNVVSYTADYSVANQTGEVRSRGLELEAKTQIGAASIIAAYAYTDARITQSNDPSEEGQRQQAVPRNQFSLWGDYRFGAFGLPQLRAGLGARYVDDIPSIWWAGDYAAPAYTLFDAMASYDLGRWRYSFNVTNLFDRNYVATCTYGSCFYGEPRKIVAGATYRW